MKTREDLLALLESGRDEFVRSLDGVNDAVASRRPGEGKWSIAEVAEHVAVVEELLVRQLESSTLAPEPVVNERREARILQRGTDRTNRVEAPGPSVPTGGVGVASALERFLAARARTIAWVTSCPDDLRQRITFHPMLGQATAWENLLMMAIHPPRHADQVRELRGSLS